MFSSPVYALDDTEESVVINKIRTPQPWVRFSTDYVRCFCNLPQCVTTGYMCKSSGKGCFSNFVDRSGLHPKDYRGRHGCLELLTDKHLKDSCAKHPKGLAPVASQETSLQKSRAFCCYHDMCNHIDSPQTRHLINNTLLGDASGDTYLQNTDNKIDDVGGEQVPMDYANSQVWFRAATIAVPICGAVIVFALIALAVKILRGENQNAANRKLGSSVYQRHVTCRKQHCDKLNYYDNNISKKSNNHQRPYKFQQAQKNNNKSLVIEVKKEDIETHADLLKGENNVKLKLLLENEKVAVDDGSRNGKCYIFNIENDPQCTASVNLEHAKNVKYFEDLPVLDNICDVNLSNVHSVNN